MEPDASLTQQAPLRFGILGTARITRRIVADMQATPGIMVHAIASRDPSRAAWYAQQYGIGQSFGSYDALLACPDIDAVYLPLPPALHNAWGIATAEAGKHLLCEKPLACDTKQFDALENAFRSRGRVVLDATAWLHHPRTTAMQQTIHQSLGTVRHLSAAVSFYEPFQSNDHRLVAELGGGCLLDLGWYAAGVWAWIHHEPPTEVHACERSVNGTLRSVTAMAQWSCGTTATLNCAYDTSTRKWFEVAGSERSLVCDDFTRPWTNRPARCWIHDRSGAVQRLEFTGNQEQQMLANFREMVAGTLATDPWWDTARRTQRILDQVRHALDPS